MGTFETWLLIVGAASGGIWYLRRPKIHRNDLPPVRIGERASAKKTVAQGALPFIPKGLQIYDSRLSVAGIKHRAVDVASFMRSAAPSLYFEPEPSNPHDENAIKVMAASAGARHFLGYIPAATAKQIALSGVRDLIKARLEYGYEWEGGKTDVIFQILGPKSNIARYRECLGAAHDR